jgi:telomerase reverse transcriptase
LHHSKTIPVSAESQQKHPRSRKKAWQGPKPPKPPEYSTIVELATPAASVSAFCQAVLLRVIPHGFWGTKKNQDFNKAVFLKKVDHFISLRRFEQLSLHEIIQDLRVTDMDWLAPPNLKGQKSSLPETQKRLEILLEFVYYIFDSILIPLIRSNFYVTESNVHKYRLFFFRHDTWRHVAEPAMTALKTTMFEEVKMEDAVKILGSRHIGFSQVRLLPKGLAMRPITNLRRRMLVKANNKQFLGPSINTVLGPVASMLKFEKSINPQRLGSAMFSVGDIYQRLKGFKTVLGDTSKPLYLAKVDVQGAFDSIPQQAVSELMGQIPTQREYKLAKHVEVKPSDLLMTKGATVRPLKKWQTWAKATHDRTSFREKLEESLALGKRNTVFVESVASRSHRTRALMALMTTHIQDNLVKMGKKFYRQKNGIPQGSVLSSTLCNYFYADLEQTHLSFLQEDSDSLLLRLIDDFLLITTSRSKAIRFVEIMQGGIADYGVTVNPAKTLVNFDMSISGRPVPRLETGQAFPYCGSLINPTTLSIWKNHETPSKGAVVFDSLTVEHTRSPGATFKRKLLNAFKIQSHLMFFDTSHNTLQSVLSSIFSAYVETANKTWAYARCLPRSKRPTAGLVIGAIKELMGVSYLLLAGKSRAARWPGYKCGVKKTQMHWLGMVAFRMVLGRKQAGYKEVLAWLDEEVGRLGAEGKVDVRGLVRVVEKVQGVFKVKY